jgi:hypothetical protein
MYQNSKNHHSTRDMFLPSADIPIPSCHQVWDLAATVDRTSKPTAKDEVLILFWTPLFADPTYNNVSANALAFAYRSKKGGRKKMIDVSYLSRCWFEYFEEESTSKCSYRDARSLATKNSLQRQTCVVVFSNYKKDQIHPPPSYRRPDQIWTFFSQGSPLIFPREESDLSSWNGLFNWTVTYRLDSDIPVCCMVKFAEKMEQVWN